MIEHFNQSLFLFINATPASAPWLISLARVIARNLIMLIPLFMLFSWLWGCQQQLASIRRLLIKTGLTMLIGMLLSYLLGVLFPHQRPFVDHLGYQFLPHAPDNSFPSDHGTFVFCFALSFLFWHSITSGIMLLIFGAVIGWSRVYLGVHWPFDMFGAVLVALIACLLAQFIWEIQGEKLFTVIERFYRVCCALPIRKGWCRR